MLNLPRFTRALREIRDRAGDEFMLRVRISVAVLAAYWVVIFLATHIPARPGPSLRSFPVDKVAHFVIYAGLTSIMAWTWHGRKKVSWNSLLVIWLIAALYGMVDEGTQALVPRRVADLYDWLVDLAGAAAGLVGFVTFNSLASAACNPSR